MDLAQLNALSEPQSIEHFLRCCGSSRWAQAMAGGRPFLTFEQLADASDRIWWSLDEAGWREAFAAHPRIGQSVGRAPEARGGNADWSAAEQSGVRMATPGIRERLAAAQAAYERRFGYIFIVCASGKTASEMLGAVEGRLQNAADDELRIAAGEQAKITRLRLAKLLPDNHEADSCVGTTRQGHTCTAVPKREQPMITTHVLDTARGRPAQNMTVILEVRHQSEWIPVGRGATDDNGRLMDLIPENHPVTPGTYRLTFDTGNYHREMGIASPFFPAVKIVFNVDGAGETVHVPLLVSPFGYSTYRGF